jgi:hypothetical protein
MGLRGALLTVTLLLAPGPLARAQSASEPPPLALPPGLRVRVLALSLPGQRIEGTLQSADSTAITLVPNGAYPLAPTGLSLPTKSVVRLEVALEKRRHGWQGAAIGALAGALLVGLGSDVDPVLCKVNSDVICSRAEAFGTGAAGGGLIGLVIGALIQTDRYTPVAIDSLRPPPASVVRARPSPRSLQLTVRF